MLVDFRDENAPDRWSADVVIAGTGPAGLSLAFELARAGRSVVLLEAGGRAFEPDSQSIYEGESLGRTYPISATRLRQFGGTTGHWSGQCDRLRPFDLRPKAWNAEDIGWAFPWEDLEPHYAKAQDFLELGSSDAAALLSSLRSSVEAGDSQLFAYERAWRFRGREPLRLAARDLSSVEREARISCVLHANVVGCDRSEDGSHVTALRFRTLEGREGSASGSRFVLACGGLENPRLVLNMLDAGPLGDPSTHRHLGLHFQEHPSAEVASIALNPTGAGYVQAARNQTLADDGSGSFRAPYLDTPAAMQMDQDIGGAYFRFYSRQGVRRYMPRRLPASKLGKLYVLARNVDEIAYSFLSEQLERGYERMLVFVECEQAPKSANAVRLSDVDDRLGLRTLQLDWRVTDDEVKTARVAAREMGRFLAQQRFGRLNVHEWLIGDGAADAIEWGIAAHHIGTTRMARTAQDGVVDSNLRVFGVDNLYIAGSSVFPSSGYVNPTLTITALSYRLADHLVEVLG